MDTFQSHIIKSLMADGDSDFSYILYPMKRVY